MARVRVGTRRARSGRDARGRRERTSKSFPRSLIFRLAGVVAISRDEKAFGTPPACRLSLTTDDPRSRARRRTSWNLDSRSLARRRELRFSRRLARASAGGGSESRLGARRPRVTSIDAPRAGDDPTRLMSDSEEERELDIAAGETATCRLGGGRGGRAPRGALLRDDPSVRHRRAAARRGRVRLRPRAMYRAHGGLLLRHPVPDPRTRAALGLAAAAAAASDGIARGEHRRVPSPRSRTTRCSSGRRSWA